MADAAQRCPRLGVIIIEVVGVAGHALIVAGALELDRAILHGGVAQRALQAPQLFGVRRVHVDFAVGSGSGRVRRALFLLAG